MKLYVFPLAPNPAKVLLYLAEKSAGPAAADLARIERVQVDLGQSEQRSPEHLARNPAGKLPVLELDDGSCVTESLAIIEYLEERFPQPPLIGRTPEERAFVRSRERILDIGVLMAGGRWVHTTNSPLGLPANPAVAEFSRAAFVPALGLADAWLADSEFVAGPRITIADCTLWAALRFLSFFGFEADERLEKLRRWKKQIDERPSALQL